MTALTVLAAAVLGIVGAARATRLVTSDAYPPMVWGRIHLTNGVRRWPGDWTPLWECPFCFAPYAVAVNLTWALWSGAWDGTVLGWSWAAAWWVVNAWAAFSYLAAMLVVRDEPPAED